MNMTLNDEKGILEAMRGNIKPLFIPLKSEYYEAFEDGTKTEEVRVYGARWNHKTCKVGREVVLSKGYGKHSRMTGKIAFFAKILGTTLSDENKQAVEQVYGTLDILIALIGIENVRPQSL